MKKFRFRLERVLDYRNVEKKDRERELARCHHELSEREERLDEIVEAQDRNGVPAGKVITMAELSLTGGYQAYLRKMLEHQRVLVQEAVEAVDAARDAYIEKAIETETLETLKDRRHEEWKDEKRHSEKKEIDELVVQRHRMTKGKVGGHDD